MGWGEYVCVCVCVRFSSPASFFGEPEHWLYALEGRE